MTASNQTLQVRCAPKIALCPQCPESDDQRGKCPGAEIAGAHVKGIGLSGAASGKRREHEAAGFPHICDNDIGDFDTRLGAGVPPITGQVETGARSVASVPDFSGVWAHPYLTGFEPPASGPGPVRNRSRRRDGIANFQQLVGDYTNPILQPWAAEVVKKHGEISLAGQGYPTPSNQCWPGGVPYVFWDFLLQIFQRPDHILMIYRQGPELRHVRMNEAHPAEVTPSWYGDSVGHYEGDVLVIDTVGIKRGPFAMVDMYGTPHSPALHVVERYRLVDYDDAKDAMERNAKENSYIAATGAAGIVEFDPNYRGKVLQLHFTVEDEGVFTMPWTATITYRPNVGPWSEVICAENIHWYPGKNSEVPQADKPDF